MFRFFSSFLLDSARIIYTSGKILRDHLSESMGGILRCVSKTNNGQARCSKVKFIHHARIYNSSARPETAREYNFCRAVEESIQRSPREISRIQRRESYCKKRRALTDGENTKGKSLLCCCRPALKRKTCIEKGALGKRNIKAAAAAAMVEVGNRAERGSPADIAGDVRFLRPVVRGFPGGAHKSCARTPCSPLHESLNMYGRLFSLLYSSYALCLIRNAHL